MPAVLLLCAWTAHPSLAASPAAPTPADGAIRVTAKPVPLNPREQRQTRVGQLAFAGGLELTSEDTSRLHGVSGIDVAEDGRTFVAVTDEGDMIRGRLRLSPSGRLVGVEQVTLRPLLGEDGRPLQGKQQADAEDIALLPGGGFAVSFEREHRVLAYAGGEPRVLFRADAAKARRLGLSENGGIEALTHDGSALLGGSEAGAVWALGGSGPSPANLAPEPPRGFALTGLDAIGGDWVGVYRAFSLLGGMRAVIAALPAPRCIRAPCQAPHGLIELARLAPPLTADNFEGIAAVRRPGGGLRLYIVSDDNFSPRQRTLLLAFDWSP